MHIYIIVMWESIGIGQRFEIAKSIQYIYIFFHIYKYSIYVCLCVCAHMMRTEAEGHPRH